MDNAFQYAYSYKWTRPTRIPFPHIWHRFQAKSSSGKIINARIEDLTPDKHDEVWEFFARNYFHDEPIAKALRLTEDKASLESLEWECKAIMKQNASLIAVIDEPGPNTTLMGVHIKSVVSKDDRKQPPPERLITPMDKYNYICLYFQKDIDMFRAFDCDTYFDDFGLCVEPEFRGLSVPENLLLVAAKYAVEFKIRGELVTIVNPNLRPVARRFGFRLIREVVIGDLKDEEGNPLVPFTDLESIHLGVFQYF